MTNTFHAPPAFGCAKRVADPTNERAACLNWCGDCENCYCVGCSQCVRPSQGSTKVDAKENEQIYYGLHAAASWCYDYEWYSYAVNLSRIAELFKDALGTNLVPGADSKSELLRVLLRKSRSATGSAYCQVPEDKELADRVDALLSRAAAKVGANVAADLPPLRDMATMMNRAANYLREPSSNNRETAQKLDDFATVLWGIANDQLKTERAAGAPAETPAEMEVRRITADIDKQMAQIGNFSEADIEPETLALAKQVIAAQSAPAETPKPVAWIVFAEDDGAWVPQFPAHARSSDAEHDASLFGQTPTEVRPLFDAAQPAPIAGDVEKDALDAKRYRKIKADNDDCDAETFCLFFDSKSGGLISIESKDMDAELDAAMLAKSSSGEAG